MPVHNDYLILGNSYHPLKEPLIRNKSFFNILPLKQPQEGLIPPGNYNNLPTTVKETESFFKKINVFSHIKKKLQPYLEFSAVDLYNNINLLMDHKSVQKIILYECNEIDEDEFGQLIDNILIICPNLERLHLKDCNFIGFLEIDKFCKSFTKLQKLKIDICVSQSIDIDQISLDILVNAYKKTKIEINYFL